MLADHVASYTSSQLFKHHRELLLRERYGMERLARDRSNHGSYVVMVSKAILILDDRRKPPRRMGGTCSQGDLTHVEVSGRLPGSWSNIVVVG